MNNKIDIVNEVTEILVIRKEKNSYVFLQQYENASLERDREKKLNIEFIKKYNLDLDVDTRYDNNVVTQWRIIQEFVRVELNIDETKGIDKETMDEHRLVIVRENNIDKLLD